HLPDMRGSNEALPLAGSNFLNTWRNRALSELYNKIKDTMPVSNPGSLGEQDTLNLVAFILQTNGAPAGTQALTPAATVLLGSVALGRVIGAGSKAAAPAGEDGPPAPRRTGSPAGQTVVGDIKN